MTKKKASERGNDSTAAVSKPVVGGIDSGDAGFDDAISRNRRCPLPIVSMIPQPPKGYRATPFTTRHRRLRTLANGLRPEALAALTKLQNHAQAVRDDLGKFAPAPAQIDDVHARLTATSELVRLCAALTAFVAEMDQIARGDALLLLGAVNKLLPTAIAHEPALASKYGGVRALFAAIGGSISRGRARGKERRRDEAGGG